jgi:hypothetical protein
MRFITFIILFLILVLERGFSQQNKTIVVYAQIIDGDTLPIIPLPEIEIKSYIFLTDRQAIKMTKLIKNVKKVYPYAKLAGIKLNEYEEILMNAQSDKERKEIMKKAEEELEEAYGEDLKKMTISQGKILIKLVDRETGSTSYELVEVLRGKFRAFFYQTFARLFGYDLKTEYDPEGEDKDIEHIVRLIESGQL